jgi:hypothetical protein
MQDHHFDELREALGAQQGEGFEEKLAHMLNNKVGDELDDDERDRLARWVERHTKGNDKTK